MANNNLNLGYFNLEAARNFGANLAIIDLSREPEEKISHSLLNERMDRVAAVLQSFNLKIGARLILAMENRFEFVEAFFGTMRAGLIPIPLNNKLGADTIRFILRDSNAEAAIVSPLCNPNLVEIVDGAGLSLRIAADPVPSGWDSYERLIAGADPLSVRDVLIEPRQTAFLPYTSGSTGLPKGVLLPHDGMLWSIRTAQQYWPADASDRALIAGPLFHKNAMRVSVKPKLRVGGSVVIMPHFEPRLFLHALSRFSCTHTGGVPAMYRMILEQKDLIKNLDFPNLKSLEMGSAVVGADLIAAIEEIFRTPVIEAYGLTEGGGPLREPANGSFAPVGSCGTVAPGVEVKLVNDKGIENQKEGELWVRSPAVLTGYNNRPELNEERLVDGFLKTRDIFRRDKKGFFYFMGRADDQFSCGGENINPKEVELLLVQHPEVIDAVVVPIKHDIKGFAPAALVTLNKQFVTYEKVLKDFTLENGPSYAHPRRIFSVEEMPFNGAGKIDRNLAKKIVATRIKNEVKAIHLKK